MVKIILSNWRTKERFLNYGGDKEFVVKGYVDASFDTDPDDSKLQTVYVFILNGEQLAGAVPSKAW